MQSKAKKTDIVISAITSLSDAGYKTAKNIDANKEIARYVMGQDSKFPSEITQTTRDALYVGFQVRNNENVGHEYYYYGDTGLIPITSLDQAPKGKPSIDITVDYAMSISNYDYGKLRIDDKALHTVVKAKRDAFSKYASECLGSLVNCANKILNGDRPTVRAHNDNFRQSLEKIFNGDGKKNGGLDKKVKVAVSVNKDITADEVMYRMAKEAFFKVYTKK